MKEYALQYHSSVTRLRRMRHMLQNCSHKLHDENLLKPVPSKWSCIRVVLSKPNKKTYNNNEFPFTLTKSSTTQCKFDYLMCSMQCNAIQLEFNCNTVKAFYLLDFYQEKSEEIFLTFSARVAIVHNYASRAVLW